GMVEQARRAGFQFPYLLDDSQQVAAAYRAMCTPDLFVYDAERRLAYRGAFDDSTPRNGQPVTGALLRDALDRVLEGQLVPEPHRPSMGCSLKWKRGNQPSWLLGSG
ncbi:MAG TPA: thioredoxin family protein, partial [Actinomycetes bacterium]|nr:thioredoxin family protein [Actinomycetes bacterium]